MGGGLPTYSLADTGFERFAMSTLLCKGGVTHFFFRHPLRRGVAAGLTRAHALPHIVAQYNALINVCNEKRFSS